MLSQYLGGKKENYEAINGNLNIGGWSKAGPQDAYDGDGSTWQTLKRLALSKQPTNYESVRTRLNVPQYVDYMLMFMFGNAEAEYRAVGSTDRGSPFQFLLNDSDGFLGDSTQPNRKRTTFQNPLPGVFGVSHGDGPGSLFSLLFKAGHPDFRMLVADRIQKHFFNEGAMTLKANIARLLERVAQVEQSMIAEIARWRDGRQTFQTPSEWATMKNGVISLWLPNRSDWIASQFRAAGFYPPIDAPVISQQGQKLSLASSAGTIYYRTDGTDPRLPGGALSPQAIPYEDGRTNETIIPKATIWKYSGFTINPSPKWKLLDFDDRRWASGPAQLGYRDGDERTIIPSGLKQKQITTYFRHIATLSDISKIEEVHLQLKRDDGAAVYINGAEAARSNLTGPLHRQTLASTAQDDGKAFHHFTIPAKLLRKGNNIIAAEVHQQSLTSSDLSFDLELTVIKHNPKVPTTTLTLSGNTHIRSRAPRFDLVRSE
ncbi:MAG: hypothetical protein ACI9DF_005345 [Verrucomicrobiales bacterium]|jgi:hypothetical protein